MDRWVVVGATADAENRTRPAVWASNDGREWEAIPLHPGNDFYTAREILGSVACSRGRIALLGAKSGGAHGMPRTATWRQRPDGSLAAVRASYLLFGGSETVAVARLVGGPDGYLVAGARTSGAAVWQSPTGASFRLYQGAAGLRSTSRVRTLAVDAMPYRDRWLVAGEATDASGRLHAVTWTGEGAAPWSRQDLPGGQILSTAERVIDTPAGPDVAGLLDQGFGLWALRNGKWRLMETFGRPEPDGTAASYVSGLAYAGGHVVVTYSDGVRFRLWMAGDLPMPTAVSVDGDRTATVAAHGRDLLLMTDDSRRGRVWLTTVPPSTR
jgi:hypothetical protein